jgi:pimeloyl-ACP methyl ester carboxylesterase
MSGFSMAPSSPPPPYDFVRTNTPYHRSNMSSNHDPRSSSMQSLLSESHGPTDARRKLLLIFVHGFLGDETSFQSFPAHVHNIVSETLISSHIVHTKIYPRYKSRGQLEVIAENFSTWLAPHESPERDVILIGHSMGGLLDAEVVLMKPKQQSSTVPLLHRILGTISLDTPFLGLHPTVIKSGLVSIFKPPWEPEPGTTKSLDSTKATLAAQALTTQSSSSVNRLHADLSADAATDMNYNPSFFNDTHLTVRKGWRSTLHFIKKHSDGLADGVMQYVKSHVEFSGAMANYSQLKVRYQRIRGLEDGDPWRRAEAIGWPGESESVPVVRFVNYYTATKGRKKVGPGGEDGVDEGESSGVESGSTSRAPSPTPPRISVEEFRDDGVVEVPLIKPDSPIENRTPGGTVTETSEEEKASQGVMSTGDLSVVSTQTSTDNDVPLAESMSSLDITLPEWPPLDPPPVAPSAPDLSMYSDKTVREAVKREYDRKMKSYKQQMDDRNAILADRKKVEDKLRKAAEKEQAKRQREEEKKNKEKGKSTGMKREDSTPKEETRSTPTIVSEADDREEDSATAGDLVNQADGSCLSTLHRPNASRSTTQQSAGSTPQPPPKDRHFCVLPPKNAEGQRDPAWVRVFVKDVDVVQAHCQVFFPRGETYEWMVGDVAERIEKWVRQENRERERRLGR